MNGDPPPGRQRPSPTPGAGFARAHRGLVLSTAPRCDFWRAARRLDFLGEVASYATSCPRAQSFAISSACDPMPLTRLQAPESSCRFSTWSNPLDGRQRRSVCRCGRRVPAPLRCYGLRASPRLYGTPRTLLPRTLWSERAIARTLCGVRAENRASEANSGARLDEQRRSPNIHRDIADLDLERVRAVPDQDAEA